ncbi:MAG TPA: sigma-E factor negative regulatory protein [Rudaea sp.]|jgi:sigma-E factor negative regulatory protein RseA
MNDTTHEQLSALMDGELPRDELRFLLRRIDNDADLVQRWSRYQVASAVLKRQYAALGSSDTFAAAVLARLDADVAAIQRPLAGRLLRWAGGGAIAAGVAVFALVATRPAGTDGGSAIPVLAGPTVAAVQVPVAVPSAPVAELRQAPTTQQVLPAGFTDYAQPASFESIVPSYAPTQQQARTPASGVSEAFVPYVLVVGARQSADAQQPARRELPPKQ